MSKILTDLANLEKVLGYENLSRIINSIDELTDKVNTKINNSSNINNNFEKLDNGQITLINFIFFIARKQKTKEHRDVFMKIAYSLYLDYILSIYKITYENNTKRGGKKQMGGYKQMGGAKIRVFRDGELIRIDMSQVQPDDIPAIKVVGLDGVERYVPADQKSDSDSDDELAFANGYGHMNAALVVGEQALQNIQNGRPPVQPQQSMVQYDREEEESVLEISTSQYGEQPVTEQPDIYAFLPPDKRKAMEAQIIELYETEINIELEKKKLALQTLQNQKKVIEGETAVALEAQKEKMRLLKGLPTCGTCLECAVWGGGGGVTASILVWASKQLGYLTIVKPLQNLGSATVEGAKMAVNVTVEGAKSVHDASWTVQQGAKFGSNLASTIDNVVGGAGWLLNGIVFEAPSALVSSVKEGATSLYTSTGQLYNYATTESQTSSNLRKAIPDIISSAHNAATDLTKYVLGVLPDGQLYDLNTGEPLWMDAAHTIKATAETAGIVDATKFEWSQLAEQTMYPDQTHYPGLPVFDTDLHPRTMGDFINSPGLMASDCSSWMVGQFNSLWNMLEHAFPSYNNTLEAARPYVETPEFVCGFAGCCIMSSLYVARESMWRKSVAAAIATEGRSDPASNTLATAMTRTTEALASNTGQVALNVGTGAAALCFPAASASLATLRAITGTVGKKNENVQRSLGLRPGVQQITDRSRQPEPKEQLMLTRGQEQRPGQQLIQRRPQPPPRPSGTPDFYIYSWANQRYQPPPPPKRGGKSLRRRTHKKRIMKRRKVTRKIRKARRTRKYRK